MATNSILLPPKFWDNSDGTASNLQAKFVMQKGSNTAPNRMKPTWVFPKQVAAANAITCLWCSFPIPVNYASGGTLKIRAACGTAAAGNVRWQASCGAQTATAADSFLAHQQATAVAATGAVPATTANRPFETSITLGMDSAAAESEFYLLLQRLGSDGADTVTQDIIFLDALLNYTTV
jgi:hypothetical protein